MARRFFLIPVLLLISACSAQTRDLFTAVAETRVANATASSTPTVPATIAITPQVSTAVASTSVPLTSIPLQPRTPTPKPTTPRITASATLTRIASPGNGLSPTELKYSLLAEFGDIFFCDPDVYPVARILTDAELDKRFAAIQENTEEFQAILRHTNLQGTTAFTKEQKLLVYNEHKKLNAIQLKPTGAQYEFSLRVPAQQRNGTAIQGGITTSGAITVTSRQPTINTCPICLAGNTLIDTPTGVIPVKDLQKGMRVWTLDAAGHRQIGVILATVSRDVPAGHPMVHLLLDDSRELYASPLHPTADGRVLGELSKGDLVDGARVLKAEIISSDEAATYDLLPSGGTGLYWANGILLGSTLKSHE